MSIVCDGRYYAGLISRKFWRTFDKLRVSLAAVGLAVLGRVVFVVWIVLNLIVSDCCVISFGDCIVFVSLLKLRV